MQHVSWRFHCPRALLETHLAPFCLQRRAHATAETIVPKAVPAVQGPRARKATIVPGIKRLAVRAPCVGRIMINHRVAFVVPC
jgi:hypothetical protein